MKERKVVLLPQTESLLQQLGQQIKLCRLRREFSCDLIAERAGISRATLWAIEKGSSSVSIGAYASVLHALNGKDKDLLLICKEDELGRLIQENKLITKKRINKK